MVKKMKGFGYLNNIVRGIRLDILGSVSVTVGIVFKELDEQVFKSFSHFVLCFNAIGHHLFGINTL